MKNQISTMGARRAKITIPRFCVRLGSLSPKVKNSGSPNYSSTDYADEQKSSLWDGGDAAKSGGCTAAGSAVMVVVGSSLDGRGALEWALSHAVRSQDTVVLLQVVKFFNKDYLRAQEILHSMRRICQMRRPEVHVEVVAMVAEGETKGQVIVEEAKRRKVSLLVVGQRRRSILWRLVRRWAGERLRRGGLVDYCINYANCMTIAVRRKSRKLGGYLITTKRHKKFWLLA